jgi:hypothetical protein
MRNVGKRWGSSNCNYSGKKSNSSARKVAATWFLGLVVRNAIELVEALPVSRKQPGKKTPLSSFLELNFLSILRSNTDCH